MARIEPKRIVTAARHGWYRRDWIRHNQLLAEQQLAGPYFRTMINPEAQKIGSTQPISVLGSMIDAYLPQLVSSRWTVDCTSKLTGFQGEAAMRGLRLTHLCEELKIPAQDRLVTLDTLLCGEGMWRCGLKDGPDWVRVDSATYDPGQPFAIRVPPGNLTTDPIARHPDERRFIGDRFIADRQVLLEAGIGDPDYISTLPNITNQQVHLDPSAPQRYAGLTSDALLSDDLIELWYMMVWDGNRRLEMVVANLDQTDRFIIEPREYEGYELGPYESVRIYEHPNDANGISLAMRLMDLHLAVQRVAERTIRHVLKTKRNPVYSEEIGKETAMAINEAADDEPIPGDPNSVKEMVTGGMIDQFQRGMTVLLNLADNAGASLQQSAGRSGVADTATEASIIAGKANNLIQMIRGPLQQARRNIIKRLSWYEDTAPVREQLYSITVGPGLKSNVVYDPATREGNFSDFTYDCGIEFATSMDQATRLVRLQQIVAVLPNFVQMTAMFGGDIRAALNLFTKEYPELADIFPTGVEETLKMLMTPGMMPPNGQIPVTLQQQMMQMMQAQMGAPAGASPAGARNPGTNSQGMQLAQMARDASGTNQRASMAPGRTLG